MSERGAQLQLFGALPPVTVDVPAVSDAALVAAAAPTSTELDDAARRAALDGTRSLLLQAPAGSGKTTVLTARFLTLLTMVEQPEEILAITFTRKAAAEMRQRVMAALRADSAGDTAAGIDRQLLQVVRQRDRRLGWDLSRNPVRLRIETIDALNSRLARALPVAARSAPELTIASAPARLYERAARATLEGAWLDPAVRPAVRLLFERLDNSWSRLQALLADMLEHRSHWLPRVLGATDSGLTQRVQNSLRSLVSAELARVRAQLPAALLEEAEQLLDHAQQCQPAIPAGPLSAAPSSLQRWRALVQLALTQSGWRRRFTVGEGFQRNDQVMKERALAWVEQLDRHPPAMRLLRDLECLPDAQLAAEEQAALEALTKLLVRAAAQLQVVFAETGKVDYAYVAGAARASLTEQGEPSDFALRTGQVLRHILVDEFQDISYEQYHLLQALTIGWEAGDGRTLFLVGDPMQSIYQFREAEVGLFLRARERGIGALRLQYLQLGRNFRTQAPLLAWINRQFAQLFPAGDDARLAAIRFSASVATREAAPTESGPCPVGLHCFVNEDRDAEARRVLEIVQQARAEDSSASVAILVASREHATTLTATLREAGITLRGINLEPLAQRAAVRDLIALTRLLLHGGDRTAWLTALRAPWTGLTLAQLESLCEVDAGDFFAAVQLRAVADAQGETPALGERLQSFSCALAPALQGAERHLPLWQRAERCWLRLAGPAIYPQAADRLAVRRFLDALALHDEPEGLVGDALVTMAAQLFSTEPPQAGAVEILTMHAAKGLEWDVVILPGLGRRTAGDADPLLHWLELPSAREGSDLLLCPIRASGGDPPKRSLPSYIKRVRRARARIERVRLLYVAMTRARRQLHLLGALKSGSSAPPARPQVDSPLDILWPAIAAEFTVAQLPGTAALGPRPTPAGLQWCLPAGWVVPQPPSAPRSSGVPEGLPEHAAALEYRWVGLAARAVGTIVHAELHRLTLQSPLTEAAAFAREPRAYGAWLAELGVPAAEHAAACRRIIGAVERTLADPRGRWLLSHEHPQAQSEWRLSGLYDGRLVHVIFDRMLVDAHGDRWIVDFKTSSHEGGAVSEFIEHEVERYRAQLLRYGALARALGPHPVRLALYFPLLGVFRELPQ